jgi:hypothetical protein
VTKTNGGGGGGGCGGGDYDDYSTCMDVDKCDNDIILIFYPQMCSESIILVHTIHY